METDSIYRDALESEDDESDGWEEAHGNMMSAATRKAVRRALNAIPNADLLGVMSCGISPHSSETCLVCRLFDPEKGFNPFENITMVRPVDSVAERYGADRGDIQALYYAAADYTSAVEEMIAVRLNRIVRV